MEHAPTRIKRTTEMLVQKVGTSVFTELNTYFCATIYLPGIEEGALDPQVKTQCLPSST